jgi:endonuclease YncB( thermonuclease family)
MQRYILVLAVIISCFVSADAASLFGKVIDVSSGDVITIYNLNRPVRVKLMGVDAPEMNQAFGDVAKKHLSDLVFEKSVLVEYAGIAADSSLTGRVLLNDADIGAQMIRDGVAWFDPGSGNRLSANDREVYQQSEQAARSEKRGLWQEENPVAPWEFVKAEKVRRIPAASLRESVSDAKPRRSGPVPELTNLTLMAAGMSAASSRPSTFESNGDWARSSVRKNWSRLQPPGEDFSVDIPEDGERLTTSVPMGNEMVDATTYMVRDGWVIYSLAWFNGPTLGETDDLALKSLLRDFLKGAAEGYQRSTGQDDFKCQPRSSKNISQNGYTGVEYDLSSCTAPARLRMFTKVVDNHRQVYIGTVIYGEEDENVLRFLKSFSVGSAKATSRKASLAR